MMKHTPLLYSDVVKTGMKTQRQVYIVLIFVFIQKQKKTRCFLKCSKIRHVAFHVMSFLNRTLNCNNNHIQKLNYCSKNFLRALMPVSFCRRSHSLIQNRTCAAIPNLSYLTAVDILSSQLISSFNFRYTFCKREVVQTCSLPNETKFETVIFRSLKILFIFTFNFFTTSYSRTSQLPLPIKKQHLSINFYFTCI